MAKPDAAYFRRLLELAGVEADQALFVDDSATNIAAAREVGLRTIHHPADAGGELLRREVTQALTLAASLLEDEPAGHRSSLRNLPDRRRR